MLRQVVPHPTAAAPTSTAPDCLDCLCVGYALVFGAVYVLCGFSMFAAAYLIRWDVPMLQRAFSVAGLFELCFLINVVIANRFHSANGALSLGKKGLASDNQFYVAYAPTHRESQSPLSGLSASRCRASRT